MVDLGPLAAWQPSWMTDTSNWLYSPVHGFSHRWARTEGGDLMSGKPTPVRVRALVNPITGELVQAPAGTEIMCDDIDWMLDGWTMVWAIEWKIQQAEREQQ
jgi:hypothetical protein